MQIQSQSTLLFRNQRLFYVEQWAALLLGAICLGMSIWALFHGTTPSPGALHATFNSGIVSMCLHWSLSIAVALTGVSLLRFAFYKQPEDVAISQPHTEKQSAPKEEHGKGSVALTTNARTNGNG